MVDILSHQQLFIAEIFSCPEACLDVFENRDMHFFPNTNESRIHQNTLICQI